MPYSALHKAAHYIPFWFRCIAHRNRLPKNTKAFVSKIVHDKNEHIDSAFVEELKAELANNEQVLQYTDLGSGRQVERTVKHIFRRSSKSKKEANVLFRLVKYLQPLVSVEIGTSLGMSSLYMSMATTNPIYTFEGIPQIAAIAKSNVAKALKTNIELIEGAFDESLLPFLDTNKNIEFFFFDGNHYLEPTLRYFDWALQSSNENTVMLFDDINWSAEMQEAWKRIAAHERSILTLDLFHMGIVVLNDRFGSGNYSVKI